MTLRILRLFTHRSDGFESDKNQDRDTSLNEHVVEVVRRDNRSGAGVILELIDHHFRVVGGWSLLNRHRIVDREVLFLTIGTFSDDKIALRIFNGFSVLI